MEPDDAAPETRLLSGVDVVSIESVERRIAENAAFTERLFTAAEREYCEGKSYPAQHYAARWTAKEAFVKALDLDDPNLPSRSVAVVRESAGPELVLGDEARVRLERSLSRYGDAAEAADIDVSLAHDRSLGTAVGQVVVLVEASPNR